MINCPGKLNKTSFDFDTIISGREENKKKKKESIYKMLL